MAKQNKNTDGDTSSSLKANWSGFISQDFSKPVNVLRNDIFEELKKKEIPKGENGEKVAVTTDRSWRDFMGEVMLYLFENSNVDEMLELLTKRGYVDQRTYVEVSKANGLDIDAAKAKYNQLVSK